MNKTHIFLKNLNICSDGSIIIMNSYFNYLKRFDKIKISEKDFKSFQTTFQNKYLFCSNQLSDNKNLQYRQKYFKI